MVGADAFVGIDHARQLADEERSVVAQAVRKFPRIGGVDLQMFCRDVVGVGDHRGLIRRNCDLTARGPGWPGNIGGGKRG